MTKNTKIIIGIVGLLVVVGGAYYAYTNKPNQSPQEQASTEDATTDAATNPISGQAVSDKIPQTNPFQTQVNPYDAYKNPFNQ